MKRVITLIFLTMFLSCKKELKDSKIVIDTPPVAEIDSVKQKKLNILSSANLVDDWVAIIAFENELKRVLVRNIQSEKDIELLKKLLEDIKKTYPKRFKTPAIEARVKVLETEILMLDQSLKDLALTDLNVAFLRIQNAYNIFIGQIEALIIKEKDYEKYR